MMAGARLEDDGELSARNGSSTLTGSNGNIASMMPPANASAPGMTNHGVSNSNGAGAPSPAATPGFGVVHREVTNGAYNQALSNGFGTGAGTVKVVEPASAALS